MINKSALIRKRVILLTACFAVFAVVFYVYWRNTRLEQYEVIQSPDARFHIVVLRKSIWPSVMPGQASDAPGIVRLYDQSGRLLDEAHIPMVQQMNDIIWNPDHVEVPQVFKWQLPK